MYSPNVWRLCANTHKNVNQHEERWYSGDVTIDFTSNEVPDTEMERAGDSGAGCRVRRDV